MMWNRAPSSLGVPTSPVPRSRIPTLRATLRMAGAGSDAASYLGPVQTPREVDEVAFSEDLMG